MTVTRDQLYEQVWARPMLAVAKDYEVSANYLARVCASLNVPWPPRGYWAKVTAGHKPPQPALPPARPGDQLEWEKGAGLDLVLPRPPRTPRKTAQQPDTPEPNQPPAARPPCARPWRPRVLRHRPHHEERLPAAPKAAPGRHRGVQADAPDGLGRGQRAVPDARAPRPPGRLGARVPGTPTAQSSSSRGASTITTPGQNPVVPTAPRWSSSGQSRSASRSMRRARPLRRSTSRASTSRWRSSRRPKCSGSGGTIAGQARSTSRLAGWRSGRTRRRA